MGYYVYRLIPPRRTFAEDMTEAEAQIMQAHVAYWRTLADQRIAVVVGPVADPAETYGMAVVEIDQERDVRDLASRDPAVTSGAGFRVEISPMHRAIVRA